MLLRLVRKHRAPNGALRQFTKELDITLLEGQKAPSAKRCIKTRVNQVFHLTISEQSESTERQTVH